MIDLKERDVKAVRIEIAIGICLRYPTLYIKHRYYAFPFKTEAEYEAWLVLEGLLKLEPCIGHILDFYYKRELR